MMAELEAIKAAFARARSEALAAALVSSPPPNECRYCGKHWRQWVGSKLDGHSKCIVPAWFKRELQTLFAAIPALSYQQVATALGVSLAVMRSWVSPISTWGAAPA